MLVMPREGMAGGGDSSGEEDDTVQAPGGVATEQMDEEKEFSEEETDEEVMRMSCVIFSIVHFNINNSIFIVDSGEARRLGEPSQSFEKEDHLCP